MSYVVKAVASSERFVWLRKGNYPMPESFHMLENLDDLSDYLSLSEGEVVHYDFETSGLQYWRKEQEVVGMGVWHKNADLPAYVRLDEATMDKGMFLSIMQGYKLGAYNNVFDGGWLFRLNRSLPPKFRYKDKQVLDALHCCPLTLFRHAACEGRKGDKHSLEIAQELLLGWPADTQKQWLKDSLAANNLKKSQMYKLQDLYPMEFGYYAATDAMACGLVWEHLCSEAKRIDKSNLIEFHLEDSMVQLRELIVQSWEGLPVKKPVMKAALISVYKQTLELEMALRNHPEVKPHIQEWEQRKWAETFYFTTTEKRRKVSDAEIVKRALADYEQEDTEETEDTEEEGDDTELFKGKSKTSDPHLFAVSPKEGEDVAAISHEVVETYLLIKAEGVGKKIPHFNFDSHHDKRWLMYSRLGTGEKMVDEFDREVWRYQYNGKTFYLPPTKSGASPTGKEVFGVFSEDLSKLFKAHAKAVKLFSYIKAYYSSAIVDGKIHPTFAPSGTATGRLSATGGINCQQLPKVKEFLESFEAPKGMLYIGFDFCLHPSTEILTRRGWVGCLDVKQDDEVWQINKDSLKGSWAKPSRIIRREYVGKMHYFGNRIGSLGVTDNHRMLWSGQLTHKSPTVHSKREIRLAQDGVGRHTTLLTSSFSNDIVSDFSEHDIWMACLLQADAHHSTKGTYVIQVSVPRKREKVRELLGRDGNLCPTRDCHTLPVEHWSIPHTYTNPLIVGKEFDLSQLGSNQADVFAKALSFWDGSLSGYKTWRFSYCTTNKTTADTVQQFLVKSGYEARMTTGISKKENHALPYYLSIRKSVGLRLRAKEDYTSEEFSGEVGCVTVPEGFILVRSGGQTFITGNCALEKVIQCEFSQDPSLRELYVSGKVHDVHLYNAARIHPDKATREAIRSKYVCDEQVLDALKKEFKSARNFCKGVTFGFDYGMGAYKMFRNSGIQGFDLSFDDAKAVVAKYKETYAGVYGFGETLLSEWKSRGGFIDDAMGMPVSVPEHLTKDLVSRFVQRSGHYILMMINKRIVQLKEERGIEEQPAICDLHDERIALIKEKDLEVVTALYNEALDWVNETLQPSILFKINITSGQTLWEFKKD